ncbi:recombination regulator RecX [Bacillus suaedaesalsae]|uniref:Regulatory protein RecX n=1 Tax=Bacillus suaedaesalsae TaxID=2810349 RepID=A0ABS2DDD7_9BACI|nr:recombination regulator RecX [Bacillus suaedaesalsae]MBM6616467.1 recombination regulator RecX [Bacillus suaedaesalsae]
MAIITKITTQQKNKERYNIFLDDGKGERYAFSVHQDVLIANDLKKGKEIDELDIEEIAFADDITKAMQHAMVFLSYRMRSTLEVIQHLREKEYADAVISEVVHKLTDLKYLNDEEFARAYVRTNARVGLKGPSVLKQELIQKGMTQSLIEIALAEYSMEEQIEYAEVIVNKTLKKTKNVSSRIQQQKINEALSRKGFSQDTIRVVLQQMDTQKEESEELEAICLAGAKAHRRLKKLSGRELEFKVKQTLYQKGFGLDLIEGYLQSEEWNELLTDNDF